MRAHRKWRAYISNFKGFNDEDKKLWEHILKNHDNVLVMVRKMENEEETRRRDIFKKLCEWFPKETKTGKMIISLVPDISSITDMDLMEI